MTINHVHRVKEAAVNVRLPSTEWANTLHTGAAEQRGIGAIQH